MASRRRRRNTAVWRRLLLPGLAVVLVVLTVVVWVLVRGPGGLHLPSLERQEFGDRIRAVALERGARADEILADQPIQKVDGVFVRHWHLALPSQEALDGLVDDLGTEVAAWQGELRDERPRGADARRLVVELGIESFDLGISVQQPSYQPVAVATATPRPRPTATPRPEPPSWARGRLAILLDDAGQNRELNLAAAALPEAVAISVLPFLPYSSEAAAEMHRSGHEVWLHLPMEPADPDSQPGPGAIMVDASEAEIRQRVRAALNNVPHVVGVNHHMGSRASTDLRTMTWVMQEIGVRGLAYIDSRTSVNTVAEEAARAQGVRTGRRHVFLDNERTPAAIRRQLAEAVYRARMEGKIIAIGHLCDVTVRTLEQELPGLAERGADLVPPTELLD